MSYPLVEVEKLELIDSVYVCPEGYNYSAVKLIEASKGLTPFEMPLACVVLDVLPFRCNTLDYFIFQANRVENTSLEHPIILSSTGQIADGWHRVVKAIMLGKTSIKAIRLKKMPQPDSKDEQ